MASAVVKELNKQQAKSIPRHLVNFSETVTNKSSKLFSDKSKTESRFLSSDRSSKVFE